MKTRKLYQIAYTNARGNAALLNVKARNKEEAIANAKDICYTGNNFHIIRAIELTNNIVYMAKIIE